MDMLDADRSPNAVSVHAGTSQVDFEVDCNAARADVEAIPSRSSEEDTKPWHQVRRRKPSKPRVIPSEATRPEQPSTADPASPTAVLKGAVPTRSLVAKEPPGLLLLGFTSE